MPSRTSGILSAPAPAGQLLPGLPGQAGGQLIGAEGAPGPRGDPVIAGDREHVGDALGLQPGAQRPVVTVMKNSS